MDWHDGSHETIRFEADPYVMGTAHPTAVHRGDYSLVVPPIVDDSGFLFVTKDSQGQVMLKRVKSLEQDPASICVGCTL
jgi:hypothetical protein